MDHSLIRSRRVWTRNRQVCAGGVSVPGTGFHHPTHQVCFLRWRKMRSYQSDVCGDGVSSSRPLYQHPRYRPFRHRLADRHPCDAVPTFSGWYGWFQICCSLTHRGGEEFGASCGIWLLLRFLPRGLPAGISSSVSFRCGHGKMFPPLPESALHHPIHAPESESSGLREKGRRCCRGFRHWNQRA